MSSLAESLEAVRREHRAGERWDPFRQRNYLACACGMNLRDDGHDEHIAKRQAEYLREHFTDHADELGLESEQWVMTPEGLGRRLHPWDVGQGIGSHLKGLGWWIETRYRKTVRESD